MSKRIACALVWFAAVCIAVSAQDAPPRQPTPGENLARGKTCRFTPAPNYRYCTDVDDVRQLTDGRYNGCVWTEKGTVGWQIRYNRVTVIELDLGEASPICGVTFDTITGSAQVTFPSAVLVFVSNDGQQYRYLCDVMTETLPQTRLLNHRFAATGLKGWGRYVRLALLPGGFYIFCDEIEVMKGGHAESEAEYVVDTVIDAAEVLAYADRMKAWATQKNTTLTLLREAEEAIATRANALDDKGLLATFRVDVMRDRRALLADFTAVPADYRRGPPYRDPDRRAFRAVARANSRLWPKHDVVVWQNSRWEWLRPLDAPIGRELGAHVRVDMMGNEWANASFVVTSASEDSQELSLAVADFAGPQVIEADEILRLAQVVHAEAFGYNYRDDPVVPLAEGPVVLAPGISKRIWLTFKTRGAAYKPGLYTSNITIAVDGKKAAVVPVELRIWPMRFPDQVSLHSNTWGYFDDPCIAGREAATARDLVEHYNTALTLNHRYLPKPKPDKNGHLTEPLDFTKLDQMLAWNRECRLWLIWVGFEFGFGRMGTPGFGTPAWRQAFTEYVTQVRDHLAEKGIGKKQFAWYWSDEPGGKRWEEYDYPASKLLKEIDPEMLVWANPTRRLSTAQFEAALPYVDIYCPSLGTLADKGVLDVCHRTREPSWMYVCASEKNCDPFAYYRWFSWKAWQLGLSGIGMWVYVDRNAATFSDYSSGVSYAMIYKGEKGVIGSKRWNAWRQGIADYEYLRMLRDAATAARKAGFSGQALAKAESILGEGVAKVIGDDPHGGDRSNRDLPDQYRCEILACLAELQVEAR